MDTAGTTTFSNEEGKSEMVEDELMNGAETVMDDEGAVVSISTGMTPDRNRWESMPSVANFSSSLVVLDLHKARYIESLHESVCQLSNLKKLVLTHCERLKTLPDAIGNLISLEEVSFQRLYNVKLR